MGLPLPRPTRRKPHARGVNGGWGVRYVRSGWGEGAPLIDHIPRESPIGFTPPSL
jgi:hypothetical protein